MLIIPEPFALDYELDGEAHSYTPDFLLHLRDGRRAVVEIKYQAEANTPENQRRFQVIAPLIESAGGGHRHQWIWPAMQVAMDQ
ncbi:TnsA endonuclease N-terminal domain-containing protein [Chromobacterium subtsugae]|uniref:TnsA endonuclease N-terminal domain-containing protein n=1 Tax=Chromobacterium subtsugae TaxID=251747 RepID=A0ABS7FAY3_9NEIS|nr:MULTISPECIES: TnsA endonuclease N-terminal domain-containing protein [Chromobacterium]KUM02983.1 hypothetical protein Cv017_22200 [Chromobacterium subtsugae]KZE87240.1 hypothetical protein AWB61_12930 [Chromobacterium sp. F49]MBW7565804.1 TnsA endonuclease N-terminal domain-containing protein [Chromobacterium subtsugae]MBW8287156.1 TnsA endonuclease N-terminal domain-containing protein [Chromobacterium subtsugae]WSE93232.1 TnsA endonuclease N-terminal domain-containing protein [Chromobacter